ncbi:hypothetical protein [Lysobacter gummosus]|uniref:hypothetical protein n=1 Tax=Lysobacter gummosus TaxID=262324 RepID=UPI00362A54E4
MAPRRLPDGTPRPRRPPRHGGLRARPSTIPAGRVDPACAASRRRRASRAGSGPCVRPT